MSVLVKTKGIYKAYVKGSPEKIEQLCLSDSIPQDYSHCLSTYTRQGYRVIALAEKNFKNSNANQLELMKRDKVENNLIFLGFIIMQN